MMVAVTGIESLDTPLVIGLVGSQTLPGRDVAAGMLREMFGFEQIRFADPIYEILAALLSTTPTLIEHVLRTREAREQPLESLGGRTMNRALQAIQIPAAKAFKADLWSMSLRQRLRKVKHEFGLGRGLIVSNIQDEHDAELVRSVGCLIHVTTGFRMKNAGVNAGVRIAPGDYTVTYVKSRRTLSRGLVYAVDDMRQSLESEP